MRVTNLLSSAVKCLQLQGASPPDPHIGSRSRARHILCVPVIFLTGNEPCSFYDSLAQSSSWHCRLMWPTRSLPYLTKILAHPLGFTRRPITLRNHIPKICIFLTGSAYAPYATCMTTPLALTVNHGPINRTQSMPLTLNLTQKIIASNVPLDVGLILLQ